MLQKGGGGGAVQPGVRGAQGAAQRDGQERRRQAKTPPTLGDTEDLGQGGLYRGTHSCRDNVYLSDVSPNKNSWILRPLYYLSLGLIIPDRCVPTLRPSIKMLANPS